MSPISKNVLLYAFDLIPSVCLMVSSNQTSRFIQSVKLDSRYYCCFPGLVLCYGLFLFGFGFLPPSLVFLSSYLSASSSILLGRETWHEPGRAEVSLFPRIWIDKYKRSTVACSQIVIQVRVLRYWNFTVFSLMKRFLCLEVQWTEWYSLLIRENVAFGLYEFIVVIA